MVVPDADIPYEDVVATLDAVREVVRMQPDGMKSRVALFPRAVLSTMISD